MKKLFSIISLVLLIFLSACGNTGYRNINSEEANQLIENKEVVVLDVRTPEEFKGGHIPNSTLVPLQELEERMDELEEENTYLVVCRSGNRSAQASEILASNGFTKIYNMTGGMNSWTYEIEQ